jgi:hypothetical protein
MGKTAWLIEAPGRMFLGACSRQFTWTADWNKAIRFVSKEQADDVMMAVRELCRDMFPDAFGVPKPTEHSWFDTSPE